MNLILGSTSLFRKELLNKLGLSFTADAPEINETMLEGEQPQALVQRLALEKAQAVAEKHTGALIIGSDQVACIDNDILGKPGNRERAIAQLTQAAGKRVSFYTGLCLLNSDSGESQVTCDPFHVHFRPLSQSQIERYLDAEEPYNCAGSFKSEGLGISLFEKLEGNDPNSLIGLPLIRLIAMLEREGISIP
ncbi:MAG: septum formation inhibitor Maf [Gammaproteobacteria bacterium]|nr:septum formation inhibitor Maf [Gammaproteobacteria bacterium]